MKIHEHPQKTDYLDDGSDWPTIDIQGWFGDPDPLMAGHVHIVPKCPLYGELTKTTLDVPFTLKAHMFAGKVGIPSGPQIKNITWPNGTPDLIADPNGLKEWGGIAHFDLTLNPLTFPANLFKFPDHGWGGLRIFSRSSRNNGDSVDVIVTPAVWSMLNPSAPIQPPIEQGNPGVLFRSSVTIWRPVGGAIVGEMITEVNDYIPLLPINKPWVTIAQGYNYTAPLTIEPKERFEVRLDPDLHHGVPGSLLFAKDVGVGENRSFFGNIIIDPTRMGTGNHKEMVVWTQPLGAENFSSVVVFSVVVGDGVPPPQLIPVPNVVGKTQTQATMELVNAGFLLGSVMGMSDQNIPKDNVISQFPLAGTMVVPKSTVNLVTSLGAMQVPNEVWIPTVPTFMQLHINGIPQKRWQICGVDNSQTMDDCIELMTKPE